VRRGPVRSPPPPTGLPRAADVGLASRLVFAEDVRVKVTPLVGLGVDAIENGSDAPRGFFRCVCVVRCKIRGSQVQLRNVVHSTPGDQSRQPTAHRGEPTHSQSWDKGAHRSCYAVLA
jgi:hypothetical protein